ncbi:MAG: IclR family transcriptional regulator [Actinomycetales bacterium]
MAGNSADPGRSVTSKVVSILLSFTDSSEQSLTEIARAGGLPVSTAYRLVNELAAWGILERTEDSHYRVGTPLRELGSKAPVTANLVERSRRVMEDLCAATRSDVRLGVLQGAEVVYTERLAGERQVAKFWTGRRAPAHASAMGKALLAFSPASVVSGVLSEGLHRFTPYTLTSADQFRRSLAVTRLTRVAVCRWEREVGVCAVAVPVFGGGGDVVASLELSAKDLRTDMHSLQPALLVAARGLSRDLAVHAGQHLLGGRVAKPAEPMRAGSVVDGAPPPRYAAKPDVLPESARAC